MHFYKLGKPYGFQLLDWRESSNCFYRSEGKGEHKKRMPRCNVSDSVV